MAIETIYSDKLGEQIPVEDIWHPILFKGRLVRAINAGRKTQTRRIMRKQPIMSGHGRGKHILNIERVGCDSEFEDILGNVFKSPHGQLDTNSGFAKLGRHIMLVMMQVQQSA